MQRKIPKTSLRSQNSLKDLETASRQDKFKKICGLREVQVKRFADYYKVIKKLDMDGTNLIVKSYKNLQVCYARCFEVFNNEVEVLRLFKEFKQCQDRVVELENHKVVRFKEIFIEKEYDEDYCKLKGWKVYEKFNYILFNSYYIANMYFAEKHVVKHYEENEIGKIFLDLMKLVKGLADKKLRVSFRNFFIVHTDCGYGFVLENIEDTPETTESALSEQYKYTALLCYGLLKELVFAFYDIRVNKIERLFELYEKRSIKKFDRIILELRMALIGEEQVGELKIEESGNRLRDQLERYLDLPHNFRNDQIFLIDQPLFNKIRKMYIEVSPSFNRVSEAVRMLGLNLPLKKDIQSIAVRMPDCCLFDHDAIKIVKTFSNFPKLKGIYLDFSINNIGDEFVDCLVNSVKNVKLKNFKIQLNDVRMSPEGYEKLFKIVKKMSSQKIDSINIEFMNKENPIKISNEGLLDSLANKSKIGSFRLNLA